MFCLFVFFFISHQNSNDLNPNRSTQHTNDVPSGTAFNSLLTTQTFLMVNVEWFYFIHSTYTHMCRVAACVAVAVVAIHTASALISTVHSVEDILCGCV